MKYNIFTKIDGTKQYVRRFRRKSHSIVPSMLTTNKAEAFDFSSLEKVTNDLSLFGIGYAIEINE